MQSLLLSVKNRHAAGLIRQISLKTGEPENAVAKALLCMAPCLLIVAPFPVTDTPHWPRQAMGDRLIPLENGIAAFSGMSPNGVQQSWDAALALAHALLAEAGVGEHRSAATEWLAAHQKELHRLLPARVVPVLLPDSYDNPLLQLPVLRDSHLGWVGTVLALCLAAALLMYLQKHGF